MRILKTGIYLLSDFYVLYYFIYGLTAVIGVTISHFFFAFHLLDVTVRYPLLQSVLKSIYVPKKQIFLTYILFQVFNYFFSLVGYQWLSDDYKGYCDSMWECWLTAIDQPFKNDGGIGGFLEETEKCNYLENQLIY